MSMLSLLASCDVGNVQDIIDCMSAVVKKFDQDLSSWKYRTILNTAAALRYARSFTHWASMPPSILHSFIENDGTYLYWVG
jgi:hypothetical protein